MEATEVGKGAENTGRDEPSASRQASSSGPCSGADSSDKVRAMLSPRKARWSVRLVPVVALPALGAAVLFVACGGGSDNLPPPPPPPPVPATDAASTVSTAPPPATAAPKPPPP